MTRVFTEEHRENLRKSHLGQVSWNKGKKLTREHRKSLSENHADMSGINNPFYGCVHSEKFKEKQKENRLGKKMSEVTKNKIAISHKGERNWNWKGGINGVIARRARLRDAVGTHTNAEWEELKDTMSYMCLCCKRFEPEIKLTEDHIIPLSIGGSNDISNIQPLCGSCNSRKKDRHIDYINPYHELKKITS